MNPWDAVVGQPAAVATLQRVATAPVHAYLFAGPPGSTKTEAARAFAATLLGGDERTARLAMSRGHEDVREVERAGPYIVVKQAEDIIALASLSPVEGTRKVVILHEFHLVQDAAAAKLLKIIEEPPASTYFVVLADFVPQDLVTIASRCVRVDFRAIPDGVLTAQLVSEGIAPDAAAAAARAARGDLTRGRVLAHDPDLAARVDAFAALPTLLDGTGSTVMRLVDEVLARIEQAAAPLAERHDGERAQLDERIKALGERGSGRKVMEERHKRELRRHRTDELRNGLAVLAATYRDHLVANDSSRPDALIAAVGRIHAAVEALERNPNESLLLQSLFWSLPAVGSGS